MISRLIANAAGLLLAAFLVPGIQLGTPGDIKDQIITAVFVALILWALNLLVKPLLKLLTLPITVLTLGLFLLVINMVILMLTAQAAQYFGLGFQVSDWLAALLGSLIISIAASIVNSLLERN